MLPYNLKVGQIVKLRSGGPHMTIASIWFGEAKCQWFMTGELHTEWFCVKSLLLAF